MGISEWRKLEAYLRQCFQRHHHQHCRLHEHLHHRHYHQFKDERRCLTAGDFKARSAEWANEAENRQGVALSEALLVTDQICLNAATRLATRPGHVDEVIDLALISSNGNPLAKFLTELDRDHLLWVVPVTKNHAEKQMQQQKVFRYCTEDRINTYNNFQKLRRNSRKRTAKTDIVQPPWWIE